MMCGSDGAEHGIWDMDGCDLYYPAVEYLFEQNIVSGVPMPSGRNEYRPREIINRAAFTKILVLSAADEGDLPPCTTSSFPDVAAEAWFAPYVCRAKERGWISGFPDGTFKPDAPINFAEASKIIVKRFALPTDIKDAVWGSDIDGTVNVWYRPYTKALERHAAIAPTIDTFDHLVTRGEMAEMLYRLFTQETSQSTFADEELMDRGTGYSDIPPFIDVDTSDIRQPFIVQADDRAWDFWGYSMGNIQGVRIAHIMEHELCPGETSEWQYCYPVLPDWSIGFYRVPGVSAEELKQKMRRAFEEPIQEERAIAGFTAECATVGVEGEYTEYCVADTRGQALLLIHSYIDSRVMSLPGLTPFEQMDTIYNDILHWVMFNDLGSNDTLE